MEIKTCNRRNRRTSVGCSATGKRAGGAPVNFVYHATQLGAEGYAVSAVGNDLAGTEILQELDKNGIGHCIATVDYPTGTVLVELNNGIPTYNIVEALPGIIFL